MMGSKYHRGIPEKIYFVVERDGWYAGPYIHPQKGRDNIICKIEILDTSDYWNGFINDFNELEIICILEKEYELKKILTLRRDSLSDLQNEMVSTGLIVRYDISKNKIQFLTKDKTWC